MMVWEFEVLDSNNNVLKKEVWIVIMSWLLRRYLEGQI